jgi:hypothetical protein
LRMSIKWKRSVRTRDRPIPFHGGSSCEPTPNSSTSACYLRRRQPRLLTASYAYCSVSAFESVMSGAIS